MENAKLSNKQNNLPPGRQLVVWQRRFANIVNDKTVANMQQAEKFGYMGWLRDSGNTTAFNAFSTADKNAFFAALKQL